MSRMNAGIILGGQQPDLLGTIHRANQAAASQNDVQRQNALTGFYQNNGAAVARGDQAALDQLAGFDPQAAIKVQNQHQAMRINKEELEIRKQTAARNAQKWSMTQQAGVAQAEAAKIRQGLTMAGRAFQSGDEAAFQQVLQQSGVEPFPMAEFPFRAAEYEGLLEGLEEASKFGQPDVPKPMSGPGKIIADQNSGLLSDEQAAQALAPKGTVIESDGQGGFRIVQGAGVGNAPPKMTVDAAKNTGFLIRTQEANEVLNSLEGQGTRFGQQALENVPLGLGNYGRDPDFQKFDQARRDFVNAILRRESGAVISDQEFDNADKQYFPVPGDSPEVIVQKRRNRETAIEGLRVGSGPGAAYVEGQTKPFDPQTPDFSQMSDDELQAYIERGGQ